MIVGSTTEIQVLVATKPVDFRNYAERTIMRSPPTPDLNESKLSTT